MGALRINYNFQAEFSHTNLLKTERSLNSSIEKLSTGYRINSAKDDAAGLFIADQLNLVASALDQGVRNAQDGISAAQIAETTLAQIYDKLVSIYTKIEQAANDTNAAINRRALQSDIDQLVDAIDKIAKSSEFNGKKLLDGSFQNQYIHYGPRSEQKLSISIDSAKAEDLGAYVLKGDGKTSADNAKTLTSLISNSDFEYDSASDTINIQGVSITLSPSPALTDAKAIADAINSNASLQAIGIEASAVNKSVAGAVWQDITVDGTSGLEIKFYVGPETTADFTISYAKGSTVTLQDIIDKINFEANQNNLNLVAKEVGGQLVLETQGETIAVEIVTTSGQTGINLAQFIEGASGSVSNGNTGSAVKVGDLRVFGEGAFGYDLTGLSSTSTGLGLAASGTATKESINQIKVDTNDNAEFYLNLVDKVIKKVDSLRANLGSIQINLETIIQNNEFASVQQREAESRIRNVDFAKEMANFTRYQTLMQSGMAMMAQANQLPQMVLQLLR
jgi:flagellin